MNSNNRVSLDCQTPDGLAIKVSALEQEEENEFAGEEVDVVKQGEKKATSGQELQTASSKFDYEKMKVLMIDVVNPKFKNFNRPLFLAFVVGALTLAAFIALFVYLQHDCVAQSMTAATMTISTFLKENPVDCVHFALKVVDDEHGKQTFQTCRMLDMNPTTFAMEPLPLNLCPNNMGGVGYENTIRVDNPDVLPEHLRNAGVTSDGDGESEEAAQEDRDEGQEDNNDEEHRNDDDNNEEHHNDDDEEHRNNDEDSHHNGDDDVPQARRLQVKDSQDGESGGYSNEIYCVADNGGPALVVIEFDVCPDAVLTLGAAFGWVAMLELAATLVVLAIGMPTGHITNDQSFLKTMITTVNEEKETVQSGGIEMASTMINFE